MEENGQTGIVPLHPFWVVVKPRTELNGMSGMEHSLEQWYDFAICVGFFL